MEVTKKGRHLNPPLVFTVHGLAEDQQYIASIEFERKEEQHKFDKKEKTWKPWQVSEPVPEQRWTLDAAKGSDLMRRGIDFSQMLITCERGSEAPNKAVLQSLHAYSPLLVLTPVGHPDNARRFQQTCLEFVVVTKISERLREHRTLLGAVEPAKEATRKRKTADLGAPEAKRTKKNVRAPVVMDVECLDYPPIANDENLGPFVHRLPFPPQPLQKANHQLNVPEVDPDDELSDEDFMAKFMVPSAPFRRIN